MMFTISGITFMWNFILEFSSTIQAFINLLHNKKIKVITRVPPSCCYHHSWYNGIIPPTTWIKLIRLNLVRYLIRAIEGARSLNLLLGGQTIYQLIYYRMCSGCGIQTHESSSGRLQLFKSCAFNHSANPLNIHT